MKDYEAMIVLDTQGKSASGEQLTATITKEIEAVGGKLKQVDHLGLKKFPTAPRGITHGYYVNIFFQATSSSLNALKAKLKLNNDVYQQFYLAA
jgi:small subunit ribosomal protein S6